MKNYCFFLFLAKLVFSLKLYIDTTKTNLENNYFDNLVSALKKAQESNSTSIEILAFSDLLLEEKIMINFSVSIR